jgi:hypothetical protein
VEALRLACTMAKAATGGRTRTSTRVASRGVRRIDLARGVSLIRYTRASLSKTSDTGTA